MFSPNPAQNKRRRIVWNSLSALRLQLSGLLVALLCSPGVAGEADRLPVKVNAMTSAVESICIDDLKRHIGFLASDSLEGREAGSRGGKAAGAYLLERFDKLSLSPGNGKGFFQEFGADQRNLLALLEGSDPKLRNEVIVIGAHYDHVGYGYSGNSRGRPGNIHNGADDNASGVATLLEIAQALKSLPESPQRTILFALWDGEELGLLGSRHWVANPTIELARVKFYINLDMVGRLRENSLDVYGIRTAPGLRAVYARNNLEEIGTVFDWNLIPDSDHYPFLQRRIPFLMPFTRKHEDYHLPSDDADKIAYDGVERIGRHWFRIVNDLAALETLPEFRSESLREHEGMRRESERTENTFVSRLGISWISEESDAAGTLTIKTVSAGSPAADAGLSPGDRILDLNGNPFRNSTEFIRDLLRATSRSELLIEKADGAGRTRRLPLQLSGDPILSGFGWREDAAEPNVLILNQIVPRSPAADAGLMPNDRVMSINGIPADPSGGTYRQLTSDVTRFEIEFEREGIPMRTTLMRSELLAPPLQAPRPN